MNPPLISIITVVFNEEKLLEQTILSVINQTYLNIEFILIDGGSTDGTVAIVKRYENKIKFWISEPDKGVYDAMNKGILEAKGHWLYFLGSGDILLDVIHKLVIRFTDANTVYYGNVYKLDELKIYDGDFSAFKLAVKNICHQAIFYPSAVYKKYRYNYKYTLQADHDLNMRIYGDPYFRFKYLPVITCIYKGYGLSAAQPDYTFFGDKLDIIKKNFPPTVFVYAWLRNRLTKILRPKP